MNWIVKKPMIFLSKIEKSNSLAIGIFYIFHFIFYIYLYSLFIIIIILYFSIFLRMITVQK